MHHYIVVLYKNVINFVIPMETMGGRTLKLCRVQFVTN